MDLITAIEGLIILIAFFYLVNMVSHIRNIQRTLMYILVVDKMSGEIGWSKEMFTNMRRNGIIDYGKWAQAVQKSALEHARDGWDVWGNEVESDIDFLDTDDEA